MKKLFCFLTTFIFFCGCSANYEDYYCENCYKDYSGIGSVVKIQGTEYNYYYCSDCLSGDMYRCLNCGEYEDIGSGYVIETGLCDDCSGQAYVPCFECGYEFPQNTVIHYGDLYICIPCIEEIIN